MLHLLDFHEKLLNALCQKVEGSPTSEHAQSLILDILCWLAGVYSNVSWRYGAAERAAGWVGPTTVLMCVCVCSCREGKAGLLANTQARIKDMVRMCFFEAGRSVAHKCARFLALCIR